MGNTIISRQPTLPGSGSATLWVSKVRWGNKALPAVSVSINYGSVAARARRVAVGGQVCAGRARPSGPQCRHPWPALTFGLRLLYSRLSIPLAFLRFLLCCSVVELYSPAVGTRHGDAFSVYAGAATRHSSRAVPPCHRIHNNSASIKNIILHLTYIYFIALQIKLLSNGYIGVFIVCNLLLKWSLP